MSSTAAIANSMVITRNALGDAGEFTRPSKSPVVQTGYARAFEQYRATVGDRIARGGIAPVSEGALAGRGGGANVTFEPSPCHR